MGQNAARKEHFFCHQFFELEGQTWLTPVAPLFIGDLESEACKERGVWKINGTKDSINTIKHLYVCQRRPREK
jgi:hypothetical protein